MRPQRILNILNKCLINKRTVHKGAVLNEKRENPISRTFRILKDDISIAKKALLQENYEDSLNQRLFPRHVDVLIIGGGAIGSSVAYWLKERTRRDHLNVAVIEKDPSVTTFYM